MSIDSIRTLLYANGSFPDEADVLATLHTLLDLAERHAEQPADLAWGFLEAIDQWSNVSSRFDPVAAQRMRRWAMDSMAGAPVSLASRLCHVLSNVPSPETPAFLQAQRDKATDPDMQAMLDGCIAMHPVAPGG